MRSRTPRAPIPRLSRRLFAGIGVGVLAILATLLAGAVLIWRSQRAIERDLRLIVDVEEPTSAAAYEMEINVLGAGLAVQKYMLGGDPVHLERLAKDDADFGRFRAEYERLGTTPEERALARSLAPLHARYREVGGGLMELRDRRESLCSALSAQIEALVGGEGGTPDDAPLASQAPHLAPHLGALGTRLGNLFSSSHERSLDELRRARERVAALGGLEEGAQQRDPTPHEAALGRIVQQLDAVLEVQDALHRDEREFTRLRGELDALLDEGVQARTRSDLLAALDDAEGNLLRLREVGLALIGAAALVSLLAGLAVFRGSLKLRDASTDELRLAFGRLQASEARRGKLLRRLVAAQEEERARIARELHDQLGQDLAALSLGLASLRRRAPDASADGGACEREILALQELAQRLADEVHGVAWKLRPALLDDLGLHDALANLVAKWTQRSAVPVDLYCELEGRRLPPEVETTLYRAVQEALTNVAKHAGARSVNVVLKLHSGLVRLVIEDDGCGFDAEEVLESGPARGRLGLVGMSERVEQAGGSLEVESAPGKGTSILAHIPTSLRGQDGAVA